ncbi:hypothetical protein SKAU_G00253680 [Synaphobranchus kaupii]|uniref:Uncharacterized protein n=1 Tax=Synaphobranchus kaupii TaxID=118154 RepID=A0A9Q1F3D0_SYNKA|nr:hypothetical protein SKAU_G00253680 [Synaphobranchus kaupii]
MQTATSPADKKTAIFGTGSQNMISAAAISDIRGHRQTKLARIQFGSPALFMYRRRTACVKYPPSAGITPLSPETLGAVGRSIRFLQRGTSETPLCLQRRTFRIDITGQCYTREIGVGQGLE